MATGAGISKQLLSFIAVGERNVTEDVDRRIAEALLREADRQRSAAGRLTNSGGMLAESDGLETMVKKDFFKIVTGTEHVDRGPVDMGMLNDRGCNIGRRRRSAA